MHTGLNDLGARLAALAAFDPPAAGWASVLAARRQRDTRTARRWPLAAAALLSVVAAGIGWQLQSNRQELESPAGVLPYELASDVLLAQNAQLEWLLATLPERRAMRGSTAFTLAEIEDRLALVDDRLSRVALQPHAPEQVERLWQQRVDLMNSLVQVRYADATDSY